MSTISDEVKASLQVDKSEILFLYESTFSVPNGDPFTGEQRIDEETKQILVSDVRIKRFIRDFLADMGEDIYVQNDGETKSSAARFDELEKNAPKGTSAKEILSKLIDVRLFGGISTKTGNAVNLTGPVQFALLNPSLNKVDLRMHQNTSVFSSSDDKSRGAIGTTTVVPYAVCQINGWINPFVALQTRLSQKDISSLLEALWSSVNLANTRTKSNQNSLLLLQVIYDDPTKKLYGLSHAIRMVCGERDGAPLREEQIRNSDEYTLDFSRLFETVKNAGDAVRTVRYRTESDAIKAQLKGQSKFEAFSL